MRRVSLRASLLGFIVLGSCVAGGGADLIRVPYDYPTITDACEVAQSGDTVGVYPGQYFELAYINPGVSVVGMAPDSMMVWVGPDEQLEGPFAVRSGSEPVIIENMWIWAGQLCAVFNRNPNLVIQRCYLYAYDFDGSGDFSYLIYSLADFELRNCMILFDTVFGNMFLLNEPARVLMEDCVLWGRPFRDWNVPAGSRFEFRNNTIDGAFEINMEPPHSTDFSLIVVNSIMPGALCGFPPDTLEWLYNDFIGPGGWPECGYQEGNFEADPLWCDPWPADPMDYRLEPESPCRGAGENGEDVGARIGICWDPSSVPESAGAIGDLWVSEPWPNPTRRGVTLSLTTGRPERVAVEVFRHLGPGSAHAEREPAPSRDSHFVGWEAQGRKGSSCRGSYVRVRNGSQDVTRRAVVVR
jgi:hypothetical protein